MTESLPKDGSKWLDTTTNEMVIVHHTAVFHTGKPLVCYHKENDLTPRVMSLEDWDFEIIDYKIGDEFERKMNNLIFTYKLLYMTESPRQFLLGKNDDITIVFLCRITIGKEFVPVKPLVKHRRFRELEEEEPRELVKKSEDKVPKISVGTLLWYKEKERLAVVYAYEEGFALTVECRENVRGLKTVETWVTYDKELQEGVVVVLPSVGTEILFCLDRQVVTGINVKKKRIAITGQCGTTDEYKIKNFFKIYSQKDEKRDLVPEVGAKYKSRGIGTIYNVTRIDDDGCIHVKDPNNPYHYFEKNEGFVCSLDYFNRYFQISNYA